MINKKILDYVGVTKFHEMGFTGEGNHGYWDMTSHNGFKHAAEVLDWTRQIIPGARPIYYPYYNGTKVNMKKMIKDNLLDLNVSMTGIDVDFSFNGKAYFEDWKVLSQRTLVFASNGNSGKEEELKPAALKEVVGVTACRDKRDGDEYSPILAEYSTINEATMFCMPGSIELTESINGSTFTKGTSFASPLLAGMSNLMRQAFKHKFGKEADKYDIINNMILMSEDMKIEGRDKWTGYGIVRLDYDKMTDYVYHTSAGKAIPIQEWRRQILNDN